MGPNSTKRDGTTAGIIRSQHTDAQLWKVFLMPCIYNYILTINTANEIITPDFVEIFSFCWHGIENVHVSMNLDHSVCIIFDERRGSSARELRNAPQPVFGILNAILIPPISLPIANIHFLLECPRAYGQYPVLSKFCAMSIKYKCQV